MKELTDLLLKAEAGAKKIGVTVEEFFKHLGREAEHLIGIADDNVDHARQVVLGDTAALEHNAGDVLKDGAAAGVEEAQDAEKNIDGVVDTAEGAPAQASPNPAPAAPAPASPDPEEK